MAAALADAGLVAVAPVPATTPAEAQRARVLADVRAWLARIVLGEPRPIRMMSGGLSTTQATAVGMRLRKRGLTDCVRGATGGTVGTVDLVALVQKGVTDEWLAGVIWPAPNPLNAASSHLHALSSRGQPKPDFGPVPRTKAGRDAALIQHVREWLAKAASGEPVYATRMTNVVTQSTTGNVAKRLAAAGLVEKRGLYGGQHYVGVHPAVTECATWPDERLADVLWPAYAGSREAAEEPPTDVAADVAAEPGPPAEAAPTDPLSLLAERMLQFLGVLERLDARFSRLEKELGLPPLPPLDGGAP